MVSNRTIFSKLITLIVLYGVLLNVAVVLFLYNNQNPSPINLNRDLLQMTEEYIIQEMGDPPDSVKARQLSQELNVNICYKYNDVDWRSSDIIPSVDEISRSKEYEEHNKDSNDFSFNLKDRIFSIIKMPEGLIILSYYYNPKKILDLDKVIIAIVIHLCIFLVPLYFLLRKLLNPLQSLSYVVKQIGEGNFEIEPPVNRYDEFGDLARSLKHMSHKVKESIKAKEQLLMDISHELRTPLTRIKFGLELGIPKEKINEDVVEIESMITKTLDYYRNGFYFMEANLSNVDILPILEKAIASFEIQQIKIGFFNFTKNKNRIVIKADEEKLMIVFRNLISNALKYSPPDKNILVSVDETEKYYRIAVKDFGVGMKKEDMEKIFEPFSRIDSSRSKKTGGYGLGLAIVKKIIDLHNAFIEVKSEEHEGTEMIVGFRK